MKNKFKRFEGNGDVWVGDERPVRAWRLACSRCLRDQIMPCHSASPETVWQRYTKAGWRLGKTNGEDVCPECVEKERIAYRQKRDDRKEEDRAAALEALCAQTLIGSFSNGHRKQLEEPSARARVAVALLFEEVLMNNRFQLHEAHDLVSLMMRYWYLEDDTEHRKEVRMQLKIAAFTPNLKEASEARTEARRLLARIDEEREEAIRRQLDEEAATHPVRVKPAAEKFKEKFGEIEPPKPKVVSPPKPEVKPEPMPTGETEPKWLREAKARMGNWNVRK